MKQKFEIKGFSLGGKEIENGLVLAPMAGATDRAFREICRENGAELTISEMVSAKALCYEQRSKKAEMSRTAPLADVHKNEEPMSVQIFGSEPSFMAQAAALLESGEYRGRQGDGRPVSIDINMGCPVHKIVGNGEGSALMKSPKLVGEIVKAVSESVKIPVTVKIRAGWDENSINAPEIAKIAEANGAAAVFVHGRTRQQMYAPFADWSVIADVKRSVKIPVIGNGDIFTAEDARKIVDVTGCDGVMIGRGALGNPWLFSEIRAMARGEEFNLPNFATRMKTAMRHLELMRAYKGDFIAAQEAKKHIAWYIKNVRGASDARREINESTGTDQIKAIIFRLISEAESGKRSPRDEGDPNEC